MAGVHRHAQQPALCHRRQESRAGHSSHPPWWSAPQPPELPSGFPLLQVVLQTPAQPCLCFPEGCVQGRRCFSGVLIQIQLQRLGRCILPPELMSLSPIRFTRGRSSSSPLLGQEKTPLFGHHQGEGEKRPICAGHEACAGPVTNIGALTSLYTPAQWFLGTRATRTAHHREQVGQ